MIRKYKLANGRNVFNIPPANTSALTAFERLEKYVSLYGRDKVNSGALEPSVKDWFVRSHQSGNLDVCHEIEMEPVLFHECIHGSDLKHSVELIFTASSMYRLFLRNKIAGRIAELEVFDLAKVTKRELRNIARLIPDIGQCIILNFECMQWRVENNPKSFSNTDE